MKSILLTGGGSAGHVTTNLALIPHFINEGWDLAYIGSQKGIEKDLITQYNCVRYYSIPTGKLRRYFDWRNFSDPFNSLKGVFQSYNIIKSINPDIVFSKGGYVSVPVVLAAWMNNIPVIIHESDTTPGLANKLSIPFAKYVCTTFPDMGYIPTKKHIYIGPIIRDDLKKGDAKFALQICDFKDHKPILLIIGGSLGSKIINDIIRNSLDELTTFFQIIHICGKGNVDNSIHYNDYKQFEYVTNLLPDLLAIADLVISRAGSNTIFELLSLNKPMLLVPLAKNKSRGDQILNARYFEQQGFAEILYEEDLNKSNLKDKTLSVYQNKNKYINNQKKFNFRDPIQQILELINKEAKI
ncbi:undecaprenyldiphospho-muramoylpentapeptide beta-N-acetylglucosaminyltransferase [Paenibacillus polymyxa]|uniref:undecaprenyldiphospho-muramoylpentapeptide beta-N-acetylglucosaminyltransferase n=1 Tax=Paenibacillus polymyxa TaxID=1406 RepID=UPI002AB4687E|nr:undecaprenyldiphospho-muramoylpentapeptide beta-N-acetylglucosaminyltransferase [Paenibacillus polymyxa]MDY7989854.1 undecaprenyldiphospho-muramoylpentapeptide beta-N-acetylglucosaminyltransferase [Paenibacillus polymyxa]MDY8116787.1 undecaprenyldiphospho-muramoylpentapeptide beta-N-acetylglucosaminyltransferase [Paenibacillus polymyxa]